MTHPEKNHPFRPARGTGILRLHTTFYEIPQAWLYESDENSSLSLDSFINFLMELYKTASVSIV
jgi:hypothetical protein